MTFALIERKSPKSGVCLLKVTLPSDILVRTSKSSDSIIWVNVVVVELEDVGGNVVKGIVVKGILVVRSVVGSTIVEETTVADVVVSLIDVVSMPVVGASVKLTEVV